MYLYRIIVPGQDDKLIMADDFIIKTDNGIVMFVKNKEATAVFQMSNIVGFVKVKENGDQ